MDSLLCKERCLRGFYCFGKWSSVWRGLADWFGVQLSWQSFVDLACTLKILLYTQVPIPIPLATQLVTARRLRYNCEQPIFERRGPLAALSNDGRWETCFLLYVLFCFDIPLYYIYAVLRINKKKERKSFKKKYLMRGDCGVFVTRYLGFD